MNFGMLFVNLCYEK